ncbi:MAG: hypothetical protein OJF62_002776 [Pseudolabrys sp.]|nr:hypothetical protein [Pseudolabrys sp.]
MKQCCIAKKHGAEVPMLFTRAQSIAVVQMHRPLHDAPIVSDASPDSARVR